MKLGGVGEGKHQEGSAVINRRPSVASEVQEHADGVQKGAMRF